MSESLCFGDEKVGLKEYILKRIIYSVILVFFVISLNFVIFALMPGDPLMSYVAGMKVRDEAHAMEIRALFGLDKPLHERYVIYLRNMLTFDFGKSFFSKQAVSIEISNHLTNTLVLMGVSTIFAIMVGVSLGIFAAYKRGGALDTGLVTTSLVSYSFPVFWIGMIFVIVFFYQLHWFPIGRAYPIEWTDVGGWPANPLLELAGRLYHLFLPAFTLFLFSYGSWLLLTRACILETITEDYVLTAKAKGLKERTILFKHVLKNASLPLVTNVALSFGFLISGAIITEAVFTYPGMGRLTWNALNNTDMPVLQAVFYVIALCVIVANFLSDLLYGVLDPRVKYG